jgi:phosphoribosylformimino-5-aminoimidazole carboxamide ribotide isomerase
VILFPAVDLQGGRAVRLRQGRAGDSTVFADDPVAAALRWQDQGASWLHLVDLDGAFRGSCVNAGTVRAICRALSVPVQLGGGIRGPDDAGMWLEAGVRRLIIGTLALENPPAFAELCRLFPGRIGVSLDADNGRLKTRGWVHDSGLGAEEVLPSLAAAGAAFLVYTDISRDGMNSGVNLPVLARLAEISPVPVIAAGGVSSLEDIKALYPISVRANLEGVISGRALYEGGLDLREALAWLERAASRPELPKRGSAC